MDSDRRSRTVFWTFERKIPRQASSVGEEKKEEEERS